MEYWSNKIIKDIKKNYLHREKIKMDYKGKKVLVTGATGFIGSNLSKELLKRDADVYSINNFLDINSDLAKKRYGFLDKINIVNGDVSKKSSWSKIPKDIEYVFHFAAPSSITLFKKSFDKCFNETVLGLYNALEFCKENGVKKLIYPSSGAVYAGNKMPRKEDVRIMPKSLYAAAKVASEALASAYSDSVKSLGLRIFLGYGPGEERKGDFGSAPYLFIKDFMGGKKPEVWENGSQTRDLIYIDDIVEMILKAAEIDYTGIVNVGTGESISFRDLLSKIKKILNTDIEPRFVPKKTNYSEHLKADVTLNKKLFEIEPLTVDVGLRKFIAYLKNID